MRISDWSSDVCSSDLAGLVTEEDQRIFEFAGAAGGVRDYQVFRADGLVALSSWSGDFRVSLDRDILHSVIGRNETVAKVVEDSLAGTHAVIGQAFVPLTAAGGIRGALKVDVDVTGQAERRSEEHTSELQSLMRISYAVFCLKKKKNNYKT